MHTSLQSEVLLCPNCKEEVPKTLYCLNCGYPLYKIELDQKSAEEVSEIIDVEEETIDIEEEPTEKESIEEEVTIEVDEEKETKMVEEEREEIEEDLEEEVEIEPEELDEVEIEATPEEAPEPEPILEASVEVLEEEIRFEEAPESFELATMEIPAEVEEDQTEIFEIEEGAEEEEDIFEVEEEFVEPYKKEFEVVEPIIETASYYEPDPVVKEVMDNFTKNIAMKIRLVNLLKKGEVKSEIFKRLFDSYVSRGEILLKSRREILERVQYDLGSMERALNEAKEGLEELDIRKTINDISEDEYAAKAPGYQWDIKQYKDEVGKKKAEIIYLEDIKKAMTQEEIDQLLFVGEACQDSIDSLVESEKIDSDTAARVRTTLDEAITCLKSSC